jgi:hypothetical protein
LKNPLIAPSIFLKFPQNFFTIFYPLKIPAGFVFSRRKFPLDLYDPDRTVFFGQVPPMLPNAYNTQQSQVLAHNPLPFMPIGSYFNQFQGYSNQNINNPNTLFGFQPPTPNTDYNTLRHSFVPSPIPSSTLNQYNNYQNHITSFQQHQPKSSIAYSQPSS